jgi:glycopeptide antibiotics resistance protein
MRIGELLTVPWFLPGLAAALILSTGIILSATLTPLRWAIDVGATGSGICDFSRVELAPLTQLLRADEASLNVLLFMPLGVVTGMLPRSRWKAAILGVAIALPFVIETIQLLLPVLDRACESADVFDNLTGLVVGLAGGAVALRLLASARRPDG